MYRHRAFTLVELLIVIAIIVVLTGLLFSAVAKARAGAVRTRCAAQLQDVGRMLQMYFGENQNTLPHVNTMPSLRPPLNAFPSFVELLAPYDRGGTGVFHCPADQISQPAQNAPAGYETYFAREQGSYRWNEIVSIRHARITEIRDTERVTLADEYEPFHAPAGAAGSMNRLFADLHVGDGDSSFTVVLQSKEVPRAND